MTSIPELLEQATERHRAGDLVAARALYGRVLAAEPGHAAATFRLGLVELQEGRPAPAVALIRAALAHAPDDVRFLSGLGQALCQLGEFDEAARVFRRVVTLDPAATDAYLGEGAARQALGDFGGAVAAYEGALAREPGLAAALMNIGVCEQRAGRSEAAVAAYRRLLDRDADYPGARGNLGVLLVGTGAVEEGLALLEDARALAPDDPEPAANLGAALARVRRFAAAAELLGRACARHPAHPELAFNHGVALAGLGRRAEAIAAYRVALEARPDHADALVNLGSELQADGDLEAAAAAYARAIEVAPGAIPAYNNLGCLERARGRLDAAEALLRRGLALDPGHAPLHSNLGTTLKDGGELEAAIACYRAALALDPDYLEAHSNLAYSLSFLSEDAAEILAECRRFDARFAAPLAIGREPHGNDLSAFKRLRIGYVSPDFRDHCQSLFMVPLLASHDHREFAIYCYSSVARPDRHTAEVAALVDVFRDVRLLDDAALARVIRDDRIDVLVDLTMHMSHGRPQLFARKPAPVQVAWLAYPGTTGIGAIDYRLSDPRLDPEGTDGDYSERTIRLPDAFWCYHPLADGPEAGALPALDAGLVTFGCLNNPCKASARSLALFAAALAAVPGSRLVLLAPPGRQRERLGAALGALGVAPHRVSFLPFRPRAQYLASYRGIDIGLDTYPYNGHTTSLDAFWMGVPVVSRVGSTCVGRGGLSQLAQIGLGELACDSDAGFAATAARLAGDLPALAALRAGLRARLEASPLMNPARFARGIEAAYRRAWIEAAASCPGASF
jgi:predicted O-linked N-acetylglucosamine transferase (SPINDLY family)